VKSGGVLECSQLEGTDWELDLVPSVRACMLTCTLIGIHMVILKKGCKCECE
jgi:hypothetical protein